MVPLGTVIDSLLTALQSGDTRWAIRMLAEAGDGMVKMKYSLPRDEPVGFSPQWKAALAGITCWAASETGQDAPAWAVETEPLETLWSPLEDAGAAMHAEVRQIFLQETPAAILAKGVILRERSLRNP